MVYTGEITNSHLHVYTDRLAATEIAEKNNLSIFIFSGWFCPFYWDSIILSSDYLSFEQPNGTI